MQVTQVHPYLFPLEALVELILGGVMREAMPAYRSQEALVRKLRWRRDDVKRLLKQEPLPGIGGPEVFSVDLESLRGQTLLQARRTIEEAIVDLLSDQPNNCLVGRFFGLNECDVRRIRSRIESRKRCAHPWVAN